MLLHEGCSTRWGIFMKVLRRSSISALVVASSFALLCPTASAKEAVAICSARSAVVYYYTTGTSACAAIPGRQNPDLLWNPHWTFGWHREYPETRNLPGVGKRVANNSAVASNSWYGKGNAFVHYGKDYTGIYVRIPSNGSDVYLGKLRNDNRSHWV